MKNNEMRSTVNAEPGSKLEQVVLQLLKDIEANHKRLNEAFKKRKEKSA